MHVGLTGTEVSALDGIVKQAVYGVTVTLIVFCGVDAPLSCNRVGTTRTVLKAKAADVVAKAAQSGGCRGSCKSTANDDDVVFAAIGWVY